MPNGRVAAEGIAYGGEHGLAYFLRTSLLGDDELAPKPILLSGANSGTQSQLTTSPGHLGAPSPPLLVNKSR